jgi:hypothetical protein
MILIRIMNNLLTLWVMAIIFLMFGVLLCFTIPLSLLLNPLSLACTTDVALERVHKASVWRETTKNRIINYFWM